MQAMCFLYKISCMTFQNLDTYIYIYFFSQNGHGHLDENIDVLEEGEKKEDDGQQRSQLNNKIQSDSQEDYYSYKAASK